ncbi:MAG: sulfatase-like hydrolase/transferase [Flavobacteriales bacterium]|nr:sulfatase-like hydrolase/transferase [Flavobacteriales bacterium]
MNILRILLKEGLVIFLLFNLGRLLFLLGYGSVDSVSDVLAVFSHAFRLDLATISMCLVPFFLSILLRPLLQGKITFIIAKYASILLVAILSLMYAGEIITYHEWGAKLNYKIFIHLSNPSEVLKTGSIGQMLLFSGIVGVILTVYGLIRKSAFLGFGQLRDSIMTPIEVPKNIILTMLSYVLIAPLLVIVMRGGIQPIPINLSTAYFTSNMALNDAAVNSLWNLGFSVSENLSNFNDQNPFKVVEDSKAKEVVAKIYQPLQVQNTDDSLGNLGPSSLFKMDRPNVVLIIMESWSANVISSMNGPSDVTPNFDQLVKEGVLFTDFYASGYTSDLAMPAIFSSFHALPVASIVTQPSKVKHLPSLARELNNNGYSTSFYYGGQLHYGNIKSYLMLQDFDEIIEEADLNSDLPRGRLGVHDEFVFDLHQKELAKIAQQPPFFSTIFSLSSHPPYDMPMKSMKKYGTEHDEYLNSVHYADSCLGVYLSALSELPSYHSTVFMITGDHGFYAPESGDKFSMQFNNIPLLIFGAALKDSIRGTQVSKLCSQVDLAPTLLAQLNIPFEDFTWGKNVLDPTTPEFAYYSGPNSISWIRPYGYFAYENRFERYMHLELTDSLRKEELIQEGKVYAQRVFQEYMDY